MTSEKESRVHFSCALTEQLMDTVVGFFHSLLLESFPSPYFKSMLEELKAMGTCEPIGTPRGTYSTSLALGTWLAFRDEASWLGLGKGQQNASEITSRCNNLLTQNSRHSLCSIKSKRQSGPIKETKWEGNSSHPGFGLPSSNLILKLARSFKTSQWSD